MKEKAASEVKPKSVRTLKPSLKSSKQSSTQREAVNYKVGSNTKASHDKGKVITKTKSPGDLLVYINKNGQYSIEFKKAGIPVHKISFDEKISVIQSGFLKEQLLELKERYGISLETMAKILDIADRSIQNKPLDFRFTGNVAEKILGLSDIYSYGVEVFEERDKFRKWIDTPNPVLDNKRPLELFSTQLGMQQVKQELARIDYGIY